MLATSRSYDSDITEGNYDEFILLINGKERVARTHRAGHSEEFRSMDYAEEFGDDGFWEQCAIDGVLYFGVSPPGQRSPLDEHAWFAGEEYVPRIANESCISLTARWLKSRDRSGKRVLPITHFPAIRREVEYLTRTDLTPNNDDSYFMESFPYVVKAMHNWRSNDPQFVREWLGNGMNVKRDNDWGGDNFTFYHSYLLMAQTTEFGRRGPQWRRDWLNAGIEALEHDQRQFVSARDTMQNFLDQNSVQLQSPQGQTINFAWVESDNERMGSAARSVGCHLLLQMSSSGHMQLYSDYRVHGGAGINLDHVAERVQMAEQEARVRHDRLNEIITDNPAVLRREGFPYWGAVWYYVYGMLLNGSLTRPTVPFSLLPPEDLFKLVQEALIEDGYRVL